ncbi:MAG: glycosyl transferase family 1 [Spirochaetes bacterium GWD1_61_31]|nr:MAG: glycosyl transferase family 1 [Spirochaetes bacterium GWB1_60_80]OHD30794.1 MAG: glycosyl transferase family 1 [Spirochaetes bacterium GWC1_61_12]OHD36415.1 MAG: glycosyl transferase family 1 [Spirochaetes bacterium GWD1_61_31]OHD46294.1 MAG: glycosyl transferase family 1 [Spirochaetes bacterium GWE1_60_18]OHD60901.1 MAG: glycosyl transferase family 1 [Spirochaetes bacterium GWF1_60_12]HAP42841.1 glycosyl transferase family 1 [Spirochaetaceae bacterium]
MITLSKVKLGYGGRVLFQDGDLLVRPGDRIGLVGPNGAGKTSVFRLMASLEQADSGEVIVTPGTVIGYFSQDVGEMSGRSVMDEALAGAGLVHELSKELAAIEQRMADQSLPPLSGPELDRYGHLQTEFLHLDGYGLETRAEAILTGLGFAERRWREPVENFSGGWKMRIALARILLLSPHVLLIDEPTNHLDLETIVWLESWLYAFDGAIVMTSHDREFMTRLCSRTVEVAQGAITSYAGDYDFYLRERELRREQLIAAHKRQQASLAKDEEFIARFAARASHAAQVQSRIKSIGKIDRIELPREAKTVKFEFPPARRSGDVAIELKDLAKSWPQDDGSLLPVFSGVSAIVARGDKIAVAGVNGAGKSSLLKVLAGQTAASSGSCQLGAGVQVGYFSQYSGDSLKRELTIFQELQSRLPGESVGSIKNLLGAFLFSGDDSDKRIAVLSGGERTRVMLACLLASQANLLILDEPTNHLDIASREVLLEALQAFDGTVLIVSHDRYFLKHLVKRVFAVDGGALKVFEGDYEYYLEKSGR